MTFIHKLKVCYKTKIYSLSDVMLKSKFFILSCAVLLTTTGCQSIHYTDTRLLATEPVQNSLENAQEIQNSVAFKHKIRNKNKPVIALVLGSGGARGYAHIGVIELLEKNNIHPDFIVGTSAGSIVGALYASGKNSTELRQIALDLKPNDVRDITITKKGFFEGKKVENYINQQVQNVPIQSLKKPMFIVATELKEGKRVVFNYGNTGQAVRASVAIPSMFVPVQIGDDEYVDGGLVSPVPVDVAKDLGADIVIAVDILAQPIYTETSNIWGLFNQNINIMQKQLAKKELKNADIIIQPELREKVHIFNVNGREETMRAGLVATEEKIPAIQDLINNYQGSDYKK